MKIFLIQNQSPRKSRMVNKDLAGGFGTATYFGKSVRARLLTWAKKGSIIMPSLTLAYLVAIFRKQGFEVSFCRDYHRVGSADLYLIMTSIVDCNSDLEIAKYLKRKFFQAKVGFIGTFATVKPEFYIKSADFVIQGEPESYFTKPIQIDNLTGIINVPLQESLDELPFPDWSIFPYKNYSYFPTLKGKPFLPVISSRGCTFSCAHYCPYPLVSGRSWRRRSVENVISEIKYLIENYQIKSLLFRDPIFTLDRKFAREFAQQLIDQQIKIEWACETRLDCLNQELIDLLYQSGLRAFNIGVESSDEVVLKDFKRLPIKADTQESLISYCQKKGINISAFYILGLPSDTKESIKQTIKYAKFLNTNTAQFTICTPYPGTAFYDEVRDKIFETNWEKFDAYTPVFKIENLTPRELLKFKDYAHSSYYFRPGWLFKFIKKQLSSK